MDQQEEDYVSKTKRKRGAHALQDLGEELVRLTDAQLAQLALPERLLDAVQQAQRINKFGALRRQLQYIGRLMRDFDCAPIAAQLQAWKGQSREATAYLHRLERWRERLLEDDDALTEFAAAHAGCDLTQLRALIRAARKEQETQAAPRSFRELFQALKAIVPDKA
jgi:ribosome-associated protein